MSPQTVIIETLDGRKLAFSPCLLSIKPSGSLELYLPYEGRNHFIAVIQPSEYKLAYYAKHKKEIKEMSKKTPLITEATIVANLTRLTIQGKVKWSPDKHKGLRVYKATYKIFTLMLFHEQIPAFVALFDAETDSVIYRYVTENIQALLVAVEGGILEKVRQFTEALTSDSEAS